MEPIKIAERNYRAAQGGRDGIAMIEPAHQLCPA
jgi:hypothetical protein